MNKASNDIVDISQSIEQDKELISTADVVDSLFLPIDQSESQLNSIELQKTSTKPLQPVKVNLLEHKFKVVLQVYTSKNNVSWVLSDMTRKQIFYKKTGGMSTKRGYLKNSQKISLKNFEQIVEALENIKANYVFCYVKSAIGTKKHIPTTKSVIRILDTLRKRNIKTPPYIINNTVISISKIRLKGGRRGRR